ncbi:MAG: hypothetical protein HON27_18070 [Candidatus Marinimicrobia bacterium]|jgi:hypothetical protein|nr:hypothetical protein [Candidatus Neomarinimicrobiota bacterium]
MSDKKKYTLSEFKDAGIDEFIRNMTSPSHLPLSTKKKEFVAYFTPIQYLVPTYSMPLRFEDRINDEVCNFPSIREWTRCSIDTEYEMCHEAIDDFEEYRREYNKRVDEYYEKNGLTDIESQIRSKVRKYETGVSHFAFTTIHHKFHYGQEKNCPNWFRPDQRLHSRSVDNELIYNTIVGLEDEEAIAILNTTVYDYINTLTGGNIREGDLFDNPIRELTRWVQAEGLDFGEIPNILMVSEPKTKSNIKRLIDNQTKAEHWDIEHDIIDHTLKFQHKGETVGTYSYVECGFQYHKKNEIPRKVQLLEQYACWLELREDNPTSNTTSWEDYVTIKNRNYTVKIQRGLQSHLKELLYIEGDVFEKCSEEIGGIKSTYYEPLFKVTTVQDARESHKRYTLESMKNQKNSGVTDFQQAKKLGLDDGVYSSLDESELAVTPRNQ